MIAFIVHRCWVSAFQALPHLDADAGTLTFQNTTLEKEGWERDTSIQEPVSSPIGKPGPAARKLAWVCRRS